MADWQRRLELSDELEKLINDEITIQEFAGIVATKLSNLKPFPESEKEVDEIKEELIEEFRFLEKDLDAGVGEINYCLNELYDWGDIALDENGKKVCWINVLG